MVVGLRQHDEQSVRQSGLPGRSLLFRKRVLFRSTARILFYLTG
jgi:hypothetical protein